ncbi:lipoprotein 17-related variable surface protein [Metamycoplasma hyosynoviae]|uniref:lipoprotein 17-related variable surface protein n=1 Tax=Metamycoplasma hyosynoviae TaxID=29559 RepID=UPI002359CB9A|nr:lipoprotein 17-related variable surface protein [Metamycoplasma hyosynoviae]MDC8914154.1 hypothetical protein [Metamycoplasma hyosynoviae]
MTKKVLALLVLNTSILVPIISTPLLVSCKNIDYKKDVKEDFTKDKSTIFASECQSIIKFSSKSGKVKYEVELVSSNDKTGEAIVKITPIENNKLQTAFELKLTGFKIKLSEVLKDVKSLYLTEKEKYKVDDYISKFSTTLKDKVVVKTSEDLTLSAFLTKYKLDANANLKIKDLAKGIGTLNVQFKLGDQIETKEFEISGFLFDNTFTLVIDKILSATPPMDLSDKSDKTIDDYNTAYGSILKDKITCKVEGKNWNDYLTDEGFEIGNIILEAKSNDPKIGILKITITKDSKSETITKEITGFKENVQQPSIELNKAFEEPLTLDGISSDKTVDDYKQEHPNLKIQVKTTTKSNEEYTNYLEENEIELDTVTLESAGGTKANLKVKVKSTSDPSKVLEETFVLDGFKEKSTTPEPPQPPTPTEPKNAKEAAEQGKLITVDKTASTYDADVEAIKDFFSKPNTLESSRRLDEKSSGTWTLKSKSGTSAIIANIGTSIKFDEKWGKYKDVIKPAKGNGKFAQINIETKSGTDEVEKIYIEFKVKDGGNKVYKVDFWTKP